MGQPISHRLSHILSGTRTAIAVDLIGEDASLLWTLAAQAAEQMREVPDVRDVALPREALVESIDIRYRVEDLARWGLTRADAAAQVRAAYAGHREEHGLAVRPRLADRAELVAAVVEAPLYYSSAPQITAKASIRAVRTTKVKSINAITQYGVPDD